MTTGSTTDIVARLRAVLPGGWFPVPNADGTTNTPVLDGILTGCAAGWSIIYGQLAYVRAQARRLTASGVFLDMIAADFFGTFIRRRVNETDAALSTRIGLELFREKGTRHGLFRALADLTGRNPVIFEPAHTPDTGGYGSSGMSAGTGLGYGVAGGYGSLMLPFQFFVTAYRPAGQGVANVAGYGHIGGFNGMPGGYGSGAIEYVTPSMFAASPSDQDILNTINDVRPAATIAWTRLSN